MVITLITGLTNIHNGLPACLFPSRLDSHVKWQWVSLSVSEWGSISLTIAQSRWPAKWEEKLASASLLPVSMGQIQLQLLLPPQHLWTGRWLCKLIVSVCYFHLLTWTYHLIRVSVRLAGWLEKVEGAIVLLLLKLGGSRALPAGRARANKRQREEWVWVSVGGSSCVFERPHSLSLSPRASGLYWHCTSGQTTRDRMLLPL